MELIGVKIFGGFILTLALINLALGYLTDFVNWEGSALGCLFWLWLSMLLTGMMKSKDYKGGGAVFYVFVCFFMIISIMGAVAILRGKVAMVFVPPDKLAATAVGRGFYTPAIANNIFPLWNPYIFCGMPSFASLQAAGPVSDLVATKLNLGSAWIFLRTVFPFSFVRSFSDIGLLIGLYFLPKFLFAEMEEDRKKLLAKMTKKERRKYDKDEDEAALCDIMLLFLAFIALIVRVCFF